MAEPRIGRGYPESGTEGIFGNLDGLECGSRN